MKSISELQEQLEKLKKMLNAKNEILEKRHEILLRINADLESQKETPSKERINRVEGYYSYIISYTLKDLMEEGNWVVGVILSAAILDDVGKRKLKREFKGKIDSRGLKT